MRTILARMAPFMGLLVLFVAGALLDGSTFLNPYNQLNVLGRMAIVGLPAIGMTLVILTAGIDLSVGSLVSLSSVVSAMLLMERTWTRSTWLAVPVVALFVLLVVSYLAYQVAKARLSNQCVAKWSSIVVGILAAGAVLLWCQSQVSVGFSTVAILLIVPVLGASLGSLNGLLISKGQIQPFIATLGMMTIAVGLAKYLAGKGGQIHPIYYDVLGSSDGEVAGIAPRSFDMLSDKISLGGVPLIPITSLFLILTLVAVHLLLTRMRVGRYIYAIGGNEETAKLSGINVDGVKVLVYALCGGLSALGGVLYSAAYTQGKADAGITWELDAIAAVVIGGTSLMGGRGSVLGTLVGILILGYLGNILNLQEVSGEIQDILKGMIIVGAVLLQEGTLLSWLRRLRRS